MNIWGSDGIAVSTSHSGTMSGIVTFDSYNKTFNLVDPMSGSKQAFSYIVKMSLTPEVVDLLKLMDSLRNNPATKQALEELILMSKLSV